MSTTRIIISGGTYPGRTAAFLSGDGSEIVIGACRNIEDATIFEVAAGSAIWTGTFKFGGLVNLAMQDVETLGAWVQHDDAVMADPSDVQIAEAHARAHKAVMVIPSVDGPDASWQQRVEGIGCSDAVAYGSSCAFWIDVEWFKEQGGFPAFMPGKSFHVPYLQLLARAQNKRVICSQAVRVKHQYGGTYDAICSREEQRQMVHEQAAFVARAFGIGLDGWGRIAEPAVVRHDPGVSLVVEDGGIVNVGGVQVYKNPAKGLLWHAANASPTDRFAWHGKEYGRYRAGDEYRVIGGKDPLTITVQSNIGFGDVVFVAKAIRAIREAWPETPVRATSQGGYGRLLAWCEDVDSWAGAPATDEGAIETGHIGNWGGDYVPDHLCRHFGVEYKGQQARFKIPEDALKAAWPAEFADMPLLCVVPHGGWISKRWSHLAEFVAQAEEKFYVWCPGDDQLGSAKIRTPDFMQAVAALPHCKALVGFDSGLTHVAIALGIPTVVLSGPTNALGLALEGMPPNAVAIQTRDPNAGHCGPDHCRMLNSGSSCPLRGGLPGADCLDEITPASVWQALRRIIEV